jgi:hypothetical protein
MSGGSPAARQPSDHSRKFEDTEAEIETTDFNPLDRPFEPVQDAAAFLACH